MSYDPNVPPEFVIEFGGLPVNEVFRYFKEGLLYAPAKYDEDLESWPIYFDGYLISPIKIFGDWDWPPNGGIHANTQMPITRQDFYNYIDGYSTGSGQYAYHGKGTGTIDNYFDFFSTINGQKLYEISELGEASIFAVRAWGKVKSLELALFGNVTNGSNLSDSSIITSGTLRDSIDNWEICDLNFLRCAMVYMKFPDGCFVGMNSVPPPTNLSVNLSNRTFSWTNAAGFNDSQHYCLINGTVLDVTSKPVSFSGETLIMPGDLKIVTKGQGYDTDSPPLMNQTPIVLEPFTADVDMLIEVTTGYTGVLNINFNFVTTTDFDIMVGFRYMTAFGMSETQSYGGYIPSNLSTCTIRDILLQWIPITVETPIIIESVQIIPSYDLGNLITVNF